MIMNQTKNLNKIKSFTNVVYYYPKSKNHQDFEWIKVDIDLIQILGTLEKYKTTI